MKKTVLTCALSLIVGFSISAEQPSSFEVVLEHYEPIRLALLEDSMEGVSINGTAIANELRHLQGKFSDQRVGASAEVAKTVQEYLPAMIAAADAMAKATSLEPARSAFYDLSKPLVRWREGVAEGSRPSVAYCPMYKKSWLQPGQKIGNPYGGMPGCGKIVSK